MQTFLDDHLQVGKKEKGPEPFNPGLKVGQEELGKERKNRTICYSRRNFMMISEHFQCLKTA